MVPIDQPGPRPGDPYLRPSHRPHRHPRRLLPALATALLLLTGTACGSGEDGNSHGRPGGSPGERHPVNPTPKSKPKPNPTPKPKPTSGWDPAPRSIAALGDSMTTGFDACGVLVDCPKVSWATGSDPRVRSLAHRLLPEPAARSWNFARSGALMADLPDQVERAVRRKPELVTVLMGANDACRPSAAAMTSPDAFRADFEKALTSLRRALPKTQVYVAAVPDLLRLWDQGRRDPMGPEAWKYGLCQSMLRHPNSTSPSDRDRREDVRERVIAYNTALREVCARDRRCRFDRAVFDYRFTERELSDFDWFHPSHQGQQELAAMAYRTITRDETMTRDKTGTRDEAKG